MNDTKIGDVMEIMTRILSVGSERLFEYNFVIKTIESVELGMKGELLDYWDGLDSFGVFY
jgi:hypothetical protein